MLDDKRYVLMGADALGTLARDLVLALGFERAKGFLLRYGWHYGTDYARRLKKIYPHISSKEWFHLGPKIHAHTGSVIVTPIQITYDEITDFYYGEGYWTDSYEAEQYLLYFGESEHPVCFVASGHASGYISKFLGRKVICKEVECQAQGNTRCRWVVKPVEDWDENVSKEELSYFEERNLERELDKTYKRVEKQKSSLRKALKLNEVLSKSLVEDNSLQSIISILGEKLNVGVIIENQYFHQMESFNLHDDYSIINFIRDKQNTKPFEDDFDSLKSIRISNTKEYGIPHERLMTTIEVKDKTFGFISLIKEHGSFTLAEQLSLELTASICSIKLLNDMTILEIEERLINNFIDDLLTKKVNEQNLQYRMHLLGYNLNSPHYILLCNIHFIDDSQNKTKHTTYDDKQIMETINAFLNSSDKNCVVSIKSNAIVTLIPESYLQNIQQDIVSIGNMIINKIKETNKNVTVKVGISTICKMMGDYRKGYEEANKAINVSSLNNNSSNVTLFEDLGLYSNVISHKNQHELKTIAKEKLASLIEYDEKYHSEFTRTLYYFLECQGNMQETSRMMLISVGSIRYRLRKINDISDIDVNNPKDFYEAYLALQILIYFNLIDIQL